MTRNRRPQPRLRGAVPALALLALVWCLAGYSRGGDGGWTPLLVARFGNVDAIDAEGGDLVSFLKGIRNDGRFIPPLRTLIGPEIRNPAFLALPYEAWIECALVAPETAGALEPLWIFPVDGRDEYMAQLAGRGISEYEGMDGVAVLMETDADGGARSWYLEWLAGNVAVFGANRSAVVAVRRLYAENGAARGLLFGAGGRFMEPDAMLRFWPSRLATWQDVTEGRYWWRGKIDALARDLMRHWRTGAARTRLIGLLTDRLAAWPRGVRNIDLSVWFEPEGVEWRMRAEGDFAPPLKGRLGVFRRLPARVALAYALPVSADSFERFGERAGDFLLSAVGGVASRETREAVAAIFEYLRRGGLREAAWAWVPPPAGEPDLGGARLLILDWADPEQPERAWERLTGALGLDTPLTQALSQFGWVVSVTPDSQDPAVAGIVVTSESGAPLYDAVACYRRRGSVAALAIGRGRDDVAERRQVADYRSALAMRAVEEAGAGEAEARDAFTRVGPDGAGMLAFFDPVRFLQLALAETADWRPRPPDQPEAPSTRFAREMLEYGSGGAWSVGGDPGAGTWDFSGGMSWRSLARLSAALGITEAVGVE